MGAFEHVISLLSFVFALAILLVADGSLIPTGRSSFAERLAISIRSQVLPDFG